MKKLLIACLALSSCAQLSTEQKNIQAFTKTPQGQTAIIAVQAAASLFAPQYYGVISQAIYSLETGSTPSLQDIANAVSAATGNKGSEVTVIASAVNQALMASKDPASALNASAAAVNSM